jgi:hypothetical protein
MIKKAIEEKEARGMNMIAKNVRLSPTRYMVNSESITFSLHSQ